VSLVPWLVWALVVGGPSAPGQDDAGTVSARFRCVPQSVQVGEPFTLVLELEHPTGTSVFELGSTELELDPSWVVLDGRRETPVADPDSGGLMTRRLWRVVSLEPGQRTLASVVSALVADERVGSVSAAAANVEVLGLLGPAEDAPRPLLAFPEGFGQGPQVIMSPLRWAALGLAVLLWAVLLVLVWRRWRKPRSPVAAPPDSMGDLERLRSSRAAGVVAARAQHYELTSILRRATDERLGVRRDGLTDVEWLDVIQASGRISAEVSRDMSRVFDRAEAVKYAGAAPSSWALDETFDEARRTLEGVSAEEAGPR
jgi:hypothetical protein